MSLDEFVTRQSAWMGKLVQRCSGLRLTISGPAAGKAAAPWKKKRKGAAKGKTAAGKPRQPRRKAST
jgi:DNA topoisomerase-3